MENIHANRPSGGQVGAQVGMICTAVLAVAYLCFILLGVFASDWMGQPVMTGGTVPISFAFGFAIMGLGFILTCLYAVIANAADKPAQAGAAADKNGK